MATTDDTTDDWTSAWPDALAFAFGLVVAWRGDWSAGDLVWSLWLSSLVVGYATIVWSIARPGVAIARAAWRERSLVASAGPAAAATGGAILVIGGLFALAFFTVHFGMFHFVHSQFLAAFFPLEPGDAMKRGMAGMSTYLEVLRRYWWFLPSAFLAERAAFRKPLSAMPPNLAVTAEAIARRKAARAEAFTGPMAPYRNVMRMHALIFFFALAHFARLENFAVYAVVYAVYFFPWWLLRRRPESAGALIAK